MNDRWRKAYSAWRQPVSSGDVEAAFKAGYAAALQSEQVRELVAAARLMLAAYAPLYRPTEITDAFSSAVIKTRSALAAFPPEQDTADASQT